MKVGPMSEPNGWNEWGRHVLTVLQEHKDEIACLRKELSEFRQEFVELKTAFTIKASWVGALSGTILGGLVALLVSLLKDSP